MKKNRHELSAELLALTMRACGLEEEEGNIVDLSGETLGRYQVRFAPLKDKVKHDHEIIDGVLIFGDGTIELHDSRACDAYNWDDYPNSVLSEVINNIVINKNECKNG